MGRCRPAARDTLRRRRAAPPSSPRRAAGCAHRARSTSLGAKCSRGYTARRLDDGPGARTQSRPVARRLDSKAGRAVADPGMRRLGLVLAVGLSILARGGRAAEIDPTQPGPYPVGFTRMTFVKPSVTTGQPRVLD